MANSKEFISSNSIQFVNDANKNLVGTISTDISGNMVFTDEFTTNTYKFDVPDEKIGSLTLADLNVAPPGLTVDDAGQILFQDTSASAYLSNIVTDIDVISLLDKLSTIGSIYDFRVRQMTFGDYKYANVKFCTDLASTFGYFSIDKLLNDERARQLFQNEQAAIYKGTAQEALYPPYAGFLIDQDYQVNGWLNIDYLVHLALGNDFAYDDNASFSIRTKPFQDAKRVIIMMALNYVNDMFSLGSFNKLTDFGVRIVDRNTDQEVDLSYVQTNMIGQIGSNILATYTGPLKYALTRTYDNSVPHVKALDVNQCDKKYINKCDGVIFTMKDEPEAVDSSCPVCFRHELGVEIRANPHADTRINKLDLQNTIDPIHWTAGLLSESCDASANRTTTVRKSNYTQFADLVTEFGEKSYTVGYLNESRAFAGGDGTVDAGIVAGGFAHDAGSNAVQRTSTEKWNGTSWCLMDADMPVGRSLGLFSGNDKQAVFAFGASVTFASPPYDDYNKAFNPSSVSLHMESDTIVWNGSTWFTPSPYSIPTPNTPRHSVAGRIDVQITNVDNNKNPIVTKEAFEPHNMFGDNFLMKDSDFYPLSAQQNPTSTTQWFTFTRFSGIAFGGTTDTSLNLFNVPESAVTDDFEFVSWGGMLRYSISGANGSINTFDTSAGSWMVDPTRHYPVAAYGISYVGSTIRGLATGGKTGKDPSALLPAYINPSQFDEFDSPILNLAYEYNGTTWIRRDNLPEEVYYHAGVGTADYAIYWGGIHGSMEEPHIYDSTETFEDWEVVIDRFGGSIHRNGTYGLDGELRYVLFPTLEDNNGRWYQIGDPRDYTNMSKPLICTTQSTGLYALFDPATVNGTIANQHNIQITKVVDDSTLQVTTFFEGEAWKSKKIRAGDNKWIAAGESTEQVGGFVYANENDSIHAYDGNYIKNPDGTTSSSFVPDRVFAPRYNIANNLNPDYAGHTIQGGMWLWSRPTVGENVFHPDNFLKPAGTDVNQPAVVYEYIAHSFSPSAFGPISGDNTLLSFYVDYDTDHINGLDQFVWEDKISNNELAFVEKWSMPSKFTNYFTDSSILSGFSLLLNDELTPATAFPYRTTVSYAKFITPLSDMLAVDTVTNDTELDKFIAMQFRTSDVDASANAFVYDLSYFTSWTNNTSGMNFHPVSYDGFSTYFTENDGNKFTVSNFVKSSAVRDKATLFPWCDLLHGDATKRARKGDVTWNWVRESIDDHGTDALSTYLVVAETTFADFIVPGPFADPDGVSSVTSDKFWREIFKIVKYDKLGNEIWSYEITYDEDDTMQFTEPAYWVNSTYPIVGTLFGTSVSERIINDGVSTNNTVDISGNPISRTVKLWNSKTINASTEQVDIVANEQFDMTFFDWKKIVDNGVPVSMYSEARKSLIDMLDDEYKIPANAVSIYSPVPSANAWFLSMPGDTFDGMIIADSDLAINRVTRTVESSGGTFAQYEDQSEFITHAGKALVKEYISSFHWADTTGSWKLTKAFFASDISNGYVAKDYGKSTFDIPPITVNPISANPDYNFIQNTAQFAFPWNYLLQDPAMYVEMVDMSGGFWFAYGDSDNRAITGPTDTKVNVYRIGHIPDANFDNLRETPLGKTVHDNIINIRTNGSSSQFRHREALIELVNSKHGDELYDVFTTIVEQNGNKPYGDSVPYHTVTLPPVISGGPTVEVLEPTLFCCTFSCATNCGGLTSGGSACPITIITGTAISEGGLESCLSCYTAGTCSTGLPSWDQHNHEEWSVPFIESPFAGPFANEDFNVWVSSAKSDQTRWGTLIFNQVPQTGQLIVNFKTHRIGIDPANNKVYLGMLTASIGIENFANIQSGNINIPCQVTYDEYIYPTQFGTDTLAASGYAALPFINAVLEENEKFKKDPGVFCTEPVFVYVPEVSGCGVSASPAFFYTEWGTNFIQEFKGKVTDPTDPVAHKYFFTHNTGIKHGSTTNGTLPDPRSYDIIETDWRRYQDGVGFGGDIPDIDNTNCLPLKEWFVGQTAFGTPDKAIVVGGYKLKSGDNAIAPTDSASWWYLYTTNKVFKWNKNVINPEDMYNKNYTKRNFSSFYSNGENTFTNSTISYIMFDLGKNANLERRGTIDFNGTDSVTVTFDQAIPDIFQTKNMYSISMTPNANIKIWWDNKTETGFTINSEIPWTGTVDWSIFYTEDLAQGAVEDSLTEQSTYDQLKNL